MRMETKLPLLWVPFLWTLWWANALHALVLCPREPLFPCNCISNGTRGVGIVCNETNLAMISLTLNSVKVPIEWLQVTNSSIGRLFGPLFEGQVVYHLSITYSGVSQIDGSAFEPIKGTLESLSLEGNRLPSLPTQVINSLLNVTNLNLAGNVFKSLPNKGLDKLANLVELDLSRNQLGKIEANAFSGLSSLETLHLSHNQVTKLEKNLFKSVKKLKTLDLSWNRLSELNRQDFLELLNLWHFNCSHNTLSKLPQSLFTRNAQLRLLDLSYNRLKEIDSYMLRGVRFLRDLLVEGNEISSVARRAFGSTTRLKKLDLSHNRLEEVAPEMFKDMQWLESLDLGHNRIARVAKGGVQRMYQVAIDLSHNELVSISGSAFLEVANMTTLDLSHNNLTSLPTDAFEASDVTVLLLNHNAFINSSRVAIGNLTGIRLLNVSHNRIEAITRGAFSKKKLYELVTVDLSHNSIKELGGTVFEKFNSIRHLDLSHNQIGKIGFGAFGAAVTLLELDISHNNITDVSGGGVSGLISLRTIFAANNQIKKIFPISVALNHLHLERNSIEEIRAEAFPMINSLLELYLDENPVTRLEKGSFRNLLALHRLSLAYNRLPAIPHAALQDLPSLQYLDLKGNQIEKLDTRAFGVLPIVFVLKLEENRIREISRGSFEGLLQLIHLNLSSNLFESIPTEAFKGLVSLQSLDLSNNKLTRLENKTNGVLDDLLSLEVLNLSSNSLSLINDRTFPKSPYIPYKLRHIDLSYNLIPVLTSSFDDGMARVQWLSLKHNLINEIRPQVLGNITLLTSLDLSENHLRKLPKGTFGPQSLPSLAHLSLAKNRLGSLYIDEIVAMKRLLRLDLSHNRLTSVYPEFAQLSKSVNRTLNIEGNPLYCDCQLKTVIDQFVINRRKKGPSDEWDALVCDEPDSLSGRLVAELTAKELRCSQEIELKESRSNEVPDIVFRGSEWVRGEANVLRVVWLVINRKEDIAGFKITVWPEVAGSEPREEEGVSAEVAYSVREHRVTNLDRNRSYRICVTAIDSRGEERKLLPKRSQSQCTSSSRSFSNAFSRFSSRDAHPRSVMSRGTTPFPSPLFQGLRLSLLPILIVLIQPL